MNNVYEENGYQNRKDYLKSLADEYDIPFNFVVTLAEILGSNEDFDGLIVALEDYLEENEDGIF